MEWISVTILSQTMPISTRSSTMTHHNKIAKQHRTMRCRRILGRLPRQASHRARWCDHRVRRLRKWLNWTNWNNSKLLSTRRKRQLLLGSKKWEALATWASHSLLIKWILIARRTSRVTLLTHSRLVRVRATTICSYKHSELIWTKITRKAATYGRPNNSRSVKSS